MIIAEDCKYALFKEDYKDVLGRVKGITDLIIMSPPYSDARDYDNGVSWSFEDYQKLGDACWSALKYGGQVLMVLDAPIRNWRKGKGTERGFTPWKVMIDWAERVGFRVPDRLAYGRMGGPGAYGGRFRNDWEPLLWFEKYGGHNFAKPYFNKLEIAKDAKYATPGKNVAVRKKDGEFYERPASGWAIENSKIHRGTLWNYGTTGHNHDCKFVSQTRHPATYALRLAEDIVKCFSPPGGLVVDPFLGSGTSLVAAIRNGRKFIGGDLFDRKDGTPWIDVSFERLSKYGLA